MRDEKVTYIHIHRHTNRLMNSFIGSVSTENTQICIQNITKRFKGFFSLKNDPPPSKSGGPSVGPWELEPPTTRVMIPQLFLFKQIRFLENCLQILLKEE